ncbi:phosphonate C-P lyase system protein PhnH [Pseudooceanicola sp. 200-1SW]|uniref:phosphonate C-P lyase system protein PhnH n=1 Tax=Pseudooceanicola sp. 200-1SW TaxID=3425949 RepID=UPI003D800065
MASEALLGGFSDGPRQSARAFRAALEAMARPGEVQHLAETGAAPAPVSPAAATLLLVLCDPETPLHLAGDHDRPELRDWITFHCAAPLVGATEAAFVLGDWAAMGDLGQYAIGTAEYPDRSATLIVDGAYEGQPVSLSGPGIKDSRAVSLPAVTPFQGNRALFPLGLDFYFCDGSSLWALPRSTRVSEGEAV